jgi:hypothetical protein
MGLEWTLGKLPGLGMYSRLMIGADDKSLGNNVMNLRVLAADLVSWGERGSNIVVGEKLASLPTGLLLTP